MVHEITIIEAIVLGLVQGFTEWLPISSSGHLVIFQSLLGVSVPSDFDIIIMAGTIAALLLYFRRKILTLLMGIMAGERHMMYYGALIVVSGIPTGIIGFAGRQFFKTLFGQPFVVSLLIIVTGLFLLLASRKKDPYVELNVRSAVIIGIAQGIAIAPGISRSGSTIGTAILLGVKPKDAAEFSFLIGIPAMTIAAALTFMNEPAAGTGFTPLLVGIIAAFIAGYVSIDLFMKLLSHNRLWYFGIYCIIAGSIFTVLTSVM